MATFILVSGAFHAGWCWGRVVPLLQDAGHIALAPDLLGMGNDTTPLPQITLDDWAEQIAALVAAQSEPVILVGHSRGGVVISTAAERAYNRVDRLVYISAVLTVPGETLFETLEKAKGIVGEDRLPQALLPDGMVSPPREAAKQVFYSGTPSEWATRAASLLTPEPPQVFSVPLNLTEEHYGSVPRAYIECSEDHAIPIHAQRAMQERQPCNPVVTIASDHSPFYSHPEELAAILIDLAVSD